MNYSQYFTALPYKFGWYVSKLFNKKQQIDFLCGGHADYICFQSIHKLMPEIRIVARSKQVQRTLSEYDIESILYPTYPDIVIMARHLARKYPVKKIAKIGMRHGAYHFKDFVSSHKYQAFDTYMFTSEHEVKYAETKDIMCGVPIGFPKIDPMFNGQITNEQLDKLRNELGLSKEKLTVLFTATWDKSNYSAIDKWIDRVNELKADFNVLVTVHQWTTPAKVEKLKRTTTFIEDKNILPYLLLADVMIADISSIIAEFNSLDKPIITFRIPAFKRLTDEIIGMLDEMTYRIDTFDELKPMLKRALDNPNELSEARTRYNKLMFDELDGKASERALHVIESYRKDL